MINIIPNFIRNASDIMVHIKMHDHLFCPRENEDKHESLIPGIYSKFKTLKDNQMSQNLINSILLIPIFLILTILVFHSI